MTTLKKLYLSTMLVLLSGITPTLVLSQEFKTEHKLNGFVQSDFYVGDSGATESADTTFHIRRARLGLKGNISPELSYNVLGAYDGGNDEPSEVKAFNLFIKYQFTPSHALTTGQFKYTFDREARPAAHQSPFIYFSTMTSKMVGKLGQEGAAFRDIGLELSGKHTLKDNKRLQYFIGVINGNGINTNEHKFNAASDEKDVYTRLTFDLLPQLNVGLAAYQGYYYDATTTQSLSEQLQTVDAAMTYKKLTFMGAFTQGKYEQASSNDKKSEGYYVMGAYNINPKWDFLLRVQAYESNKNSSNTRLSSTDIGLNYYLNKQGRFGGPRLSVNYLIRNAQDNAKSKVWEERGAIVLGDNVNDLLVTRFQWIF